VAYLIIGVIGLVIGFGIVSLLNAAGHGPEYKEPEPVPDDQKSGDPWLLVIGFIVAVIAVIAFY
jgi:hypothetical protein